MGQEAERTLIHKTLDRAAGALGDITRQACELYYARLPEGRAQFLHHDPHHPDRLEGSMVEQALYCMMRWYECRGEIEIILVTTLPHHIESLGVSGESFAALLSAVCDTIAPTIPSEAQDELKAWRNLEAKLLDQIAIGASQAMPHLVQRDSTA